MLWQLEDIEREWLRGAMITVSPEALVDAFHSTDNILGRKCLEARRGDRAGQFCGAQLLRCSGAHGARCSPPWMVLLAVTS